MKQTIINNTQILIAYFRTSQGPFDRQYATVLLALVFLTAFSNCTTPFVSIDYDQAKDFENLKTYAWMAAHEEPKHTRGQNSLVRSRVQNAVDRQLALQGYQKVHQAPHFFVAYHMSVDEKTNIHSISSYAPSVRRHGIGRHGVGTMYTDVFQTRYEEGTLIIDILNSETKNLIWRGITKGTVNRQDDPKTKTTRINDAVQNILERFPPKSPL